jgi:hypothetical protein
VLSTAVLFLVAGFLVGPRMLQFLHLTHDLQSLSTSPSWRFSACFLPTGCEPGFVIW